MGLDFASLPNVPKGFDASWSGAITRQIWGSQQRVSRNLFGVYASALENSHQIKAFSEISLIRETGIQEARGQFDVISFIDGRTSHLDEPTSSELTTGKIGGRFLEDRTEGEIGQLQAREGVGKSANLSELLRARSSLAQRRASLIRSAMAIRTAEARLRALVNDPEYSLGSSSEFIPSTSPILGSPKENIREVAVDAITNRAEVLQGVYQVKAAGLLRDQQKRDLLPTLNLILEATSAGLDANRDLGGAYEDNADNDLGWLAGV